MKMWLLENMRPLPNIQRVCNASIKAAKKTVSVSMSFTSIHGKRKNFDQFGFFKETDLQKLPLGSQANVLLYFTYYGISPVKCVTLTCCSGIF